MKTLRSWFPYLASKFIFDFIFEQFLLHPFYNPDPARGSAAPQPAAARTGRRFPILFCLLPHFRPKLSHSPTRLAGF